MRLGLLGVLLEVPDPVKTCAVPLVATLLKGKLKVRREVLPPVLDTYATGVYNRFKNLSGRAHLDYNLIV